jgi:hypothetical protein
MTIAGGFIGSRVSVLTASATPLNTAMGVRQQIYLSNLDGANAIDIGGSNVAIGTGYQVKFGVSVGPISIPANETLYGIATAANVSVSVLTIKNTAR